MQEMSSWSALRLLVGNGSTQCTYRKLPTVCHDLVHISHAYIHPFGS